MRVEHGRVVVRARPGAPETVLEAGRSWTARPSPAPAAARAPASTRPSATQEELATRAFGQGLALLRDADHPAAAAAFARAAALAPATLAEDASYWRAVALSRAGNRGQARSALGEFLARFPLSPRAREASVMLGWLLLDDGANPAAERHFRLGMTDRSPRVRKGAQAGLAAAAAAAR